MAHHIITTSGTHYVADGDTVEIRSIASGTVSIRQLSTDPSPAANVHITYTEDTSAAVKVFDDVIADITVNDGLTIGGTIILDSPDFLSSSTINIGDNVTFDTAIYGLDIYRSMFTQVTVNTGENFQFGSPGQGDVFIFDKMRTNEGSSLNVNLGEDNVFLSSFYSGSYGTLVADVSGAYFDTDPISGNAPALVLAPGYSAIQNQSVMLIADNVTINEASYLYVGGRFDDVAFVRGLTHNVYGANAAGTAGTGYGRLLMFQGDDTLFLGGDLSTNDTDYGIYGGTGTDTLNFQYVDQAQKQEFITNFIAAGGTYDAATDTFGNATGLVWSINQRDANGGTIFFTEWEEVTVSPICFEAHTLIKTQDGEVRACDLKVGDLVHTRDNGLQPIRWIGSRLLNSQNGEPLPENFCPILIKKGALGKNRPARDLRVSRQHRMYIETPAAMSLTGQKGALIAAIRLTSIPGIDVEKNTSHIDYYHFLFDNHEIIEAEGAMAESLLLGEQALKTMSKEAIQEIKNIFPEVDNQEFKPKSAVDLIPNKKQKELVSNYTKGAFIEA